MSSGSFSSSTLATSTSSNYPTTTGTTNGNSHGLFSSAASPPLILAFLAIGLFGVATMGVVGWRRLNMGRGLILTPFGVEILRVERPESQLEVSKVIGEKPELWDLWTVPPGNKEKRSESWIGVMPLAGLVLGGQNAPPRRIQGDSLAFADSRTDNASGPSCSLDPFRRVGLCSNSRRRMQDNDTDTESENSGRQLQIAIAIAMPSPHTRERRRSETAKGQESGWHSPDVEEKVEYSLGFVEAPLHRDEG